MAKTEPKKDNLEEIMKRLEMENNNPEIEEKINWKTITIVVVISAVILGGIYISKNYQSFQPQVADSNNKTQESTPVPTVSPLDAEFICPENYPSIQVQKDETAKLVTDYLKEFPKATMTDFLTYRYSMLVKNNCQKTLDIIKGEANGEDPLTSYIEKTLQSLGQSNSNPNPDSNNNATLQEKSTADIVAEWQNRVAEVICFFHEGTGVVSSQGSGTLANLTDVDGSTMMVAITNRHVMSYNNDTPYACSIAINEEGSRMVTNADAFLSGTLEDYGYINLNKASIVDEDTWDSVVSKPMKNCLDSEVKMGDNIVILGYPAIGTNSGITVTQGIVSGIETDFYVTNAGIDHGNSGGAAILTKDDCYLGIPTWVESGSFESLGRILKSSFVIKN